MDYSKAQSIAHKVTMALLDWKGDEQKCLVCATTREAMPATVELYAIDGVTHANLTGSVFVEGNWMELYIDQDDDVKAVVCRDCAIRRKLVKDPDEIPVAVPTTPKEIPYIPDDPIGRQ